MPYWYNVDTKSVETDETRGQDATVMGPYDTEAQARKAIEHARENTDRWDDEDRDWENKNASPGWADEELED